MQPRSIYCKTPLPTDIGLPARDSQCMGCLPLSQMQKCCPHLCSPGAAIGVTMCDQNLKLWGSILDVFHEVPRLTVNTCKQGSKHAWMRGRGRGAAALTTVTVWFPRLHLPPRRQALVYTTRDFHWMISTSSLPQRMRFTRPTHSYTTRALRQVRPVSLRIKLRGLSIPARVAIILSLDVNAPILGSHEAECR